MATTPSKGKDKDKPSPGSGLESLSLDALLSHVVGTWREESVLEVLSTLYARRTDARGVYVAERLAEIKTALYREHNPEASPIEGLKASPEAPGKAGEAD